MEQINILDELQQSQTVHLDKCPICGWNKWEYFGGRFHFGLRVEYWICKKCVLVAQSPRLMDEYLSKFYTQYYRFLYEGDASPTKDEFEFQKERGRNLLTIFIQNSGVKKIGNILDFGCSAGGLLSVAVDEFHATSATGIELDQAYGALAHQNGFTIFSMADDMLATTKNFFDLVVMSHVLEHISDLLLTLNQIYNLLRDGGYICVEVPHSSGGANFEVTHLWAFNETSLSKLLNKAGFLVVDMKTHGYPRVPQKPNTYLVVVARKVSSFPSEKEVRSSPYRERMKLYRARKPLSSFWSYQRLLIINTIKQLLGYNQGKYVAYSWTPSRLPKR